MHLEQQSRNQKGRHALPVWNISLFGDNTTPNKESVMKAFMDRYQTEVKGALSGWDRLAFRGTLRWLATPAGLSSFLSSQGILLKHFKHWAEAMTNRVRRGCEEVAQQLGIHTEYLRSCRTDKEAFARGIAEARGIQEGPICMLSVVEPTHSVTVQPNRATKRLEVVSRQRQCVRVYFYFNDPEVGFGHVRLESWIPFTIKGCLNGRLWLERSLMREGIGYVKQDNCFRAVQDVPRAQALAHAQLRTDWPGLLNRLTDTYFPVMRSLLGDQPMHYYWSADETEWATDVMFRNTATLDRLFPMLARHGLIVSDSPSVMRYLGKISQNAALPAKISGDVRGDRRKRHEGICVKHRAGRNSVKAYNKAGNVLRVETTINDTRAFKVFRQANDDTRRAASWLPMRKGVADLQRRAHISHASNARYLHMLAACPTDATFLEVVGAVCRPVCKQDRRVRALNPSAEADLNLLRFLTQGQLAVAGLRNRGLAVWLDPRAEELPPEERRRLAARVSRLLFILKTHGLIRKVPKTHRYLVTPKGLRVAALVISTSTVQAEELMRKAA